MGNRYLICLFCLGLFSCSSTDDEGIDCSLFDPAFENFIIEVLDSDGNNLIANGTYDQEEVRLIYEGKSIGYLTNNRLAFETIGQSEETFTVILNDTTFDTLLLDIDRYIGPCEISFYTALSAKYNNEAIAIRELNDYTKIITVIK